MNIELVRSSPNVSFFKPVSFENTIDLAYHHVVSDVKLSLLIEERSIDVELHYESLFATIVMHFLGLDDRI